MGNESEIMKDISFIEAVMIYSNGFNTNCLYPLADWFEAKELIRNKYSKEYENLKERVGRY
jgi:hypothetical protein